jgi:Protein of unknown function (DUF1616)
MADGEVGRGVGPVRDALALHPKTVAELLEICRSKHSGLSEREILEAVKVLDGEGGLVLRPRRFESFGGFLLSPYWNTSLLIVLAISVSSTLLYFIADGLPWSLLQIFPGLLLIFYLPGHSLLRILLGRRTGQPLERIVLEIAASMAVIMLLGLLLNFSGLGLFSGPALASVVVMNILVALWSSFEDFSSSWLRA